MKHPIRIDNQLIKGGSRGPRIRPHYQKATRRERVEAIGHDMSESTLDAITDHRDAHRAADDEADARWFTVVRTLEEMADEKRPSGATAAPDDNGELGTPPHAERGGQHRTSDPRRSGRETCAATAPPGGEDGATRTGAHAQPEAVGLGATAIVRLVRTLAHWSAPVVGTALVPLRVGCTVFIGTA